MCAIKQQSFGGANGDILLKKTGTKHNNGDSAIKGVEFKLDNPDAGTTRNTMLGWLINS
jgi:hypothetical protein